MNLGKLNIVIRPRSAFEGLDLGFAVASQWFTTLWLLWIGTALPLVLLIHALCFAHPLIALLLSWWAKPLFETPLLYWLSRRIFNEAPSVQTIFRSVPTIVRPQLLTRLFWRRFSPSRSFYMPVIFLEVMKGKDYAKRADILGSNQSAGYALTFICFLFELLVYVSVVFLIEIMVPEALVPSAGLNLLFNTQGGGALASNLLAILAMSLIAPFYIAAGFSLYLTRRTLLEAWDIELRFKRLMAREKTRTQFLSLAFLCFFLFPGNVALLPLADASAQASAPAFVLDKKNAKQRIGKILKSDDFGSEKTVTYWRLRSFRQQGEPQSNFLGDFFTMLIRFVSFVVKPVLWIAGGTLFVFFLYAASKALGFSRPLKRKTVLKPPAALFGLSLAPDSMPDDIVGAARMRLAAGDERAALSHLYRGALSHLIYQSFLEIPASATEGECMAHVRKSRPGEEALFFRELTLVWLKMAYGHIRPDARQVMSLCREWGNYYA